MKDRFHSKCGYWDWLGTTVIGACSGEESDLNFEHSLGKWEFIVKERDGGQ